MSGRDVKFEVFRGQNGRWYWHATVDGRIIADSGQGYATKWNAKRALRRWQKPTVTG